MMNQLPPPPLHWRWLREFRQVHPDQRATPGDVQHMLSLLYVMKKFRYQSSRIIANSPVVVQDLVFNSILAAANESLERLAESAGHELPGDLRRRFAPTRAALEKLWDPNLSAYFSRNYHGHHLIREPTVATFMPLFAGTASPSRAAALRRLLVSRHSFNPDWPVPSVPIDSPTFEPQRYWRGPVWINMNWFIIAGLERYGFSDEADWLRARTLALVSKHNFREYYNPITGEGLGAHGFSWSAALTLDLLR
jgi:glycogen debranching enzyme